MQVTDASADRCYLNEMPNEIGKHIQDYLGASALGAVRQTCKKQLSIMGRREALKKRFEISPDLQLKILSSMPKDGGFPEIYGIVEKMGDFIGSVEFSERDFFIDKLNDFVTEAYLIKPISDHPAKALVSRISYFLNSVKEISKGATNELSFYNKMRNKADDIRHSFPPSFFNYGCDINENKPVQMVEHIKNLTILIKEIFSEADRYR